MSAQFLGVLLRGGVNHKTAKAVVSELVGSVPIVELDLADEGVVTLYGMLDEGGLVEIQHALLSTHLNLDRYLPLSITMSNVAASSFALYALQHTLNQIRREGRRIVVHLRGLVIVEALAGAQAADHKIIEPDAFVAFTDATRRDNCFGDEVLDRLIQAITSRSALTPEVYRAKCEERGTLSAAESLEIGLVDEIAIIPPRTVSSRGNRSCL